ncbi:PPR repeat [Musa troglodytarum]|uniref:PPR repeat n=1 Tax=Musa troglodytarum TaxID=320322 RepID=A0A9E7HK65_9LILI|nr:PPR repeat [Musa troglodytarum]
MPMVLDSIVCPSREEPGNQCPFVAIKPASCQKSLLFFLTEGPPVDPWVQLVEPSKPAALPCTNTRFNKKDITCQEEIWCELFGGYLISLLGF